MTEEEQIARAKARRTALYTGTAVVAAAAGAGWAWLRQQPSRPEKWAEEELWSMKFDEPGGGELDMATLRGKRLVINFWATWCAPCVKEMPQLERFHADHAAKGWHVVGLAIDAPTPVREFLKRVPVTFAIGLAGLEGTQLSRSLGNDKGALPFSVVLDARGAVEHTKLGETSYEELAGWAASARS